MIVVKKIDTEFLKGTVTIRVPKYAERLKLIKDFNLKFNSDAEQVVSMDMIDQAIKMNEMVPSYVETVDMKAIVDGAEVSFKSLADFECYAEYQNVLSIIFNVVMQGASLGNI